MSPGALPCPQRLITPAPGAGPAACTRGGPATLPQRQPHRNPQPHASAPSSSLPAPRLLPGNCDRGSRKSSRRCATTARSFSITTPNQFCPRAVNPTPLGACPSLSSQASLAARHVCHSARARTAEENTTPMAQTTTNTSPNPTTLSPSPSGSPSGSPSPSKCLLCVPVTAPTVEAMSQEMQEAARQGCDVVEVRVDLLQAWCAGGRPLEGQLQDLEALMGGRPPLPVIVTCRAAWEGGKYGGPEDERLRVLGRAMELGAEFVDIELKAADRFFSEHVHPLRQRQLAGGADTGTPAIAPGGCRVIVSHHRFEAAQSPLEVSDLEGVVGAMVGAGADIAKFAIMPCDIADNAAAFRVLQNSPISTVALLMGERGLVSRVLAPKYGAFLTFAALSADRGSAPGQPLVQDMLQKYGFRDLKSDTKVYGVIGNPVAHSKSPVLHNAAFRSCGEGAVYVPLLVDDLPSFLKAFDAQDYAGFSVTIPHKLAALECCDEVEPLAQSIGAVNTLIRTSDGRLKGYNTDCEAAIAAIEDGLRDGQGGASETSPLAGRVVVVVGAGGAGRALAFGAKAKGARVVVTNRSGEKAEELAAAVGGAAMPLSLLQDPQQQEALGAFLRQQQEEAQGERGEEGAPGGGQGGGALGPVLANSTSLGMHPNVDQSPACAECLGQFAVVFDAVYTPLRTRLLRDAEAAGAGTVSGLEMFVGQAARQFELFTGKPAPVELMRQVVLDSL